MREGARALDPQLDEMAQAFRFSRAARLRHVVAPQLAPYLAAATRSGLSLVWKIVLVVELLGRSNGVGFEINMAFQLFDVQLLLAYAIPFVALMLGVETLLVQPLERHVSRWRRGVARRRDRALRIIRRANGRPLRALEDLRLTLPTGQAGAVVGPSGCGKTTLLRIIAGLEHGLCRRDRAAGAWAARHGVSGAAPFCPGAASPTISASPPRKRAKTTIAALLAKLGLAEHAHAFPGELSLGLARRVALARALAMEPDLLLLDEPFVSLDAALARELRDEDRRADRRKAHHDADRHA